jgi:DNA-binding response OmpR family regulator
LILDGRLSLKSSRKQKNGTIQNMKTERKTILVVDDDPKLLRAISLRLQAAGYEVAVAYNGAGALSFVESNKPDLIITDVWMPMGTGFSLAYLLRKSAPDIPIVFLSASKQANLKEMVREFNAADFLEKPYEPEVLLKTVSQILSRQAAAAVVDAA